MEEVLTGARSLGVCLGQPLALASSCVLFLFAVHTLKAPEPYLPTSTMMFCPGHGTKQPK